MNSNNQITLSRAVVEQALEALFMYRPMVAGVTFQHGLDAMQALRAALKQPQVEQEPYAWMSVGGTIWRHKTCADDVPLYTHLQPPRQPLTDDQIGEIEGWFSNEFGLEAKHSIDFARAIERAHGIGGEK